MEEAGQSSLPFYPILIITPEAQFLGEKSDIQFSVAALPKFKQIYQVTQNENLTRRLRGPKFKT